MENRTGKNLVRYLLFRFSFDGEPITNLKMQKLLYYVYVWYLVKTGNRCFEERFQAWPIGPVLPSVYDELKRFKAFPISPDFSEIKTKEDISNLKKELGEEIVTIADEVYEKYGVKSAFELVNLTHNELPWKQAREGLDPATKTDREINDEDILEEYGEE